MNTVPISNVSIMNAFCVLLFWSPVASGRAPRRTRQCHAHLNQTVWSQGLIAWLHKHSSLCNTPLTSSLNVLSIKLSVTWITSAVRISHVCQERMMHCEKYKKLQQEVYNCISYFKRTVFCLFFKIGFIGAGGLLGFAITAVTLTATLTELCHALDV